LGRQAPEAEAAEEDELPLIGRSPAMQDVYRVVARIAQTDLTVLILGESGTGKELVARALHDFGPRRGKAFVAVNMAAIPRESIEAELFGQDRGGFAGAAGRTVGRFEQAAGGTLFLDEIGDMPLEAQTRLLRVLETGEYSGAGGRARRADVRVIAATHQDLPRAIAQGKFREDLYYRLNVVPLALPPLRAREGDVALLAQHFLDRAETGGVRKHLDDGAVRRLSEHDWPGNVRELENLMRRLSAMTRDRVITVEDIEAQLAIRAPEAVGGTPSLEGRVEAWLRDHFRRAGDDLPAPGLYDRLLAEIDGAILRTTLQAVRGNQLKAAALLGINRNTLRKRLTELGIAPKG
jgi:two-component system, NtrC family, nitrogen regulation response regulator GlnG